MKTMTSEEYVKIGGTVCPFCGSDNVSGTEIDVDSGCAWQDAGCDDCHKSWRDQYVLTGYNPD